MTEYEAFLREAASARGINPDIAVRVANTEGGLTEPARLGDFSGPPWYSGKSWYALQLHFGGAGTKWESFGNTAGMGNGFETLTGWQPGDPAAWRDAARYGLNRARTGGWGSWYGAQSIGITGYMGVDRQHPFNPNAELWDYETGQAPALPRIIYTPTEPPHAQQHDWDCSQESAEWSLWSVGRKPSDSWMEQSLVDQGIISPELGLLDASGAGLAGWLQKEYQEFGFSSHNVGQISFDQAAADCGTHPMMLGGRIWNHWCGLRAYDTGRDVLLIANPSAGWKGVGQEMSRSQFAALGSFSAVHLTHPDLTTVIVDPTPILPPTPVPPPSGALLAQIESLQKQLAEANSKLGVASTEYARDLDGLAKGVQNVAAALRALHPQP